MTTTDRYGRSYEAWIGEKAFDRTGEEIGEITNVFLDDATGRPEWVTVKTGWFGMSSNFAPIMGSVQVDGGLRLDVDKDLIKDAPNIDDDRPITPEEERRLYEHYGIDPLVAGPEAYTAEPRRAAGFDTTRRADEGYEVGEAAMIRREEEVDVKKRKEDTGKVRLRKYVTTDHETVTVPVEKEHVVVEREPMRGESRATSADLGEEEAEVTVSEDRIDVEKRVVDKEKVKAAKDVETETERREIDLRKEEVEVEGDADMAGRRRR